MFAACYTAAENTYKNAAEGEAKNAAKIVLDAFTLI